MVSNDVMVLIFPSKHLVFKLRKSEFRRVFLCCNGEKTNVNIQPYCSMAPDEEPFTCNIFMVSVLGIPYSNCG